MTIAPLKARRSSRLNGGSAASASASSAATASTLPLPVSADGGGSSGSGSDDSSDSPTDAPLLSHEQADSSLVDPVVLQRKAVSAARQLKRALADAEDAALLQKAKSRKDGLDGVELIRGLSGSVAVEGSEEWKWGRAMSSDWVSAFLAFLMMSAVPFVVLLMLHSCRRHQCSIQASLEEALTHGQHPLLTHSLA